ncbi:unnamed protein product [Spirodela intermedia]|uniref:Uncharacterized protein n=1 Tax=Spirodela intermedia TaxID=51605 RepID=A0A7I8KY11_SPIIN|nr:unnamed protein product [Spirodela intermedia]
MFNLSPFHPFCLGAGSAQDPNKGAEKEANFLSLEKKLKEASAKDPQGDSGGIECRKLKEHSWTLSSRINLVEGDLRKVKELVQLVMESLGRAFDYLEIKVEGDCRHIHTHISDCSNDVTLMKRWIKVLVHSEEGLKVEKTELTMRLNYKESSPC